MKPLTKKDVHTSEEIFKRGRSIFPELNYINYIELEWIPKYDVLGAVELLKQKIERSAFIEHLTDLQQQELKKIIDEVFNIQDDEVGEE